MTAEVLLTPGEQHKEGGGNICLLAHFEFEKSDASAKLLGACQVVVAQAPEMTGRQAAPHPPTPPHTDCTEVNFVVLKGTSLQKDLTPLF